MSFEPMIVAGKREVRRAMCMCVVTHIFACRGRRRQDTQSTLCRFCIRTDHHFKPGSYMPLGKKIQPLMLQSLYCRKKEKVIPTFHGSREHFRDSSACHLVPSKGCGVHNRLCLDSSKKFEGTEWAGAPSANTNILAIQFNSIN